VLPQALAQNAGVEEGHLRLRLFPHLHFFRQLRRGGGLGPFLPVLLRGRPLSRRERALVAVHVQFVGVSRLLEVADRLARLGVGVAAGGHVLRLGIGPDDPVARLDRLVEHLRVVEVDRGIEESLVGDLGLGKLADEGDVLLACLGKLFLRLELADQLERRLLDHLG